MMKILENIRENMPVITRRTFPPEEFSELETALEAALVPVAPRAEFVERLNRQLILSAPLTRKQPAPLVQVNTKTQETLVIGAAAVIGVAAIFAAGLRVALMIMGMVGFFMQWGNRKAAEKQSPVQPAVQKSLFLNKQPRTTYRGCFYGSTGINGMEP